MARKVEFLDLHPYPGYRVAADGRVRYGKHPVTMRCFSDGTPYVRVKVMGRREALPVDVLVAWAFLGSPPGEGYRLAHINGDPFDVSASNLVWVVDEDYWFDFYRMLMRAPYYQPPRVPAELL